MKVQMTSGSKVIVAMLIVAVLAAGFWVLEISPRRDEAKKLGNQIDSVKSSLAEHRAQVQEGLRARREFPVDYQQLVVLGKAVPGDDDTASLLVQLNRIAKGAGVTFNDLSLSSEGGGSAPAPAPAPEAGSESTPASNPVSPTEAAASLVPLGASVGPAGLYVMPYSLTLRRHLLPARRLHRRARQAGQDGQRRGGRQRSPDHDRRLLPGTGQRRLGPHREL